MSSSRSDTPRTGWISSALRQILRMLEAETSDTCHTHERRRSLALEVLEDRTLPAWTPLGPMPQLNEQAALTLAGGNDVPGLISGKVTALAYGIPRAGGSPSLFLGSAGGGIYRTQTLAAGSTTEISGTPTWILVSPPAGSVNGANGNLVSVDSLAGINRIGCIATASAAQPNVVYAGTGDPVEGAGAGILQSTNGGAAGSWKLISNKFAGKAVVGILIDPSDPTAKTLYAAVRPAAGPSNKVTDGGIWKSIDAGVNWAPQTNFVGAGANPVILPEDISYVRIPKPGTPMTPQYRLVASVSPGGYSFAGGVAGNTTNTGIWTSDNGGTTWIRRSDALITNAKIERIKIAVSHPAVFTGTEDVMYAVASSFPVAPDTKDQVQAVMRSTTGGVRWDDLLKTDANLTALQAKVGRQTFANLTIATSDNDAKVLYLGAVDTAVSTNALAVIPTWTKLDTPLANKSWVTHGDHHAFLVPPLTNGKLAYDGNDGGIWKVQPAGATPWTDMNNAGLNTIQVAGVGAFKYTNFSVYVEGSQDNGLARKSDAVAGNQWNKTYFPIGDGGPVVFTKTGDAYTFRQGGTRKILFSAAATFGATWTPLSGTNTDANGLPKQGGTSVTVPWTPALVLTPDSSLLLLGADADVWKRTVTTNTWTPLSIPGGGPISAIAAVSNTVFYVAKTSGALYRTENGGANWTQLQSSANTKWGNHKITSVFVDLGSAAVGANVKNVVYVTVDQYATAGGLGRVFRSVDDGANFTDISALIGGAGPAQRTPLPNTPVYALAVDTNANAMAFRTNVTRPVYVGTDLGVYVTLDNGFNWTRFDGGGGATAFPVVKVTALQLFDAKSQLVVATYGEGVWAATLPARFVAMNGPIIEGTASTVVLGTLTDTSGTGPYSVSIDWGDGSAPDTASGSVTSSGTTDTVHGSHAYAEAGTFTVTTTVTSGSNTEELTSSMTVSDADLTGTPTTVFGSNGSPLSDVLVGTFTDANLLATSAADFTASIDWGDGTVDNGSVTYAGGTFDVEGSHTYTSAGTFSVVASVADDGVQAAKVTGTATVTYTGLTGMGLPVVAVQGVALTHRTVARFTDSTPGANIGAYTATIDFGDSVPGPAGNTSTVGGTIVPEGGGTFSVTGSYTYKRPGIYQVTISVDGPGGSLSVYTTATVTGSLPHLGGSGILWGPARGGIVVTLFVDNLYDASSVNFGNTPATGFTANDDGSITAIAPTLTGGSYHITVRTPSGTSIRCGTDLFTAASGAAPAVTGLDTSGGPTGGNNSITLMGTDLASTTAVSFGGVEADFTVNSDTSITAFVPAALDSTIDVMVTTAYGTSATSSADLYTYAGTAPVVSGLDMTTGSAAGGDLLTITGTNLNGATSVRFGTLTADFIAFGSDTLFVTTPALTAGGTYDVTVTTPYGGSATSSADQFTAVAAPPPMTGTTTSLSADSQASFAGQAVTFTATVSGSSPTGSVTFLDGSTVLGTVALSQTVSGAQAAFTTSGLSVGGHDITASYSGDPTNNSSTSPTLTETVQQASSLVMLSSSSSSALYGQAVTFTAQVYGSSPGLAPTGTVSWYDNGVLIAVITLDADLAGYHAALTTSSLTVGSHTITSVYSGDSNFSGSSTSLTEFISS